MSTAVPTHEFQAEVRQLLDIVIHSLYTDSEIFARELVSNASDALEKMRLLQLTEKDIFDEALPLEIRITTDETAKTLTIADHGIGMTRAELVENLGTIAHSGSKAFVNALKESGKDGAHNLIGQFGVGFYSAFMVASEVKVYTHSWRKDGEHLVWTSDGATGYTIEEVEGQNRGCKMVLQLKDDAVEFAKPERIKQILAKYSNFVTFPILLNGERINTIEALWLKNKSEVTEEQYKEFYKFAAHAFDDPKYTFHFNADAPLSINALLFAPSHNPEQFGMGQMEPAISLYCRRVLIDAKPKKFLPEWMRFIRGVVDSEDLPLNISRESMQDSSLFRKLASVVQGRVIKFLEREADGDAKKYAEFYKDFSRFIKEGVATDFENKETIAKLLRFESSLTEPGEVVSLGTYVSRMKEEQKAIYYQIAPSRAAIESGPYLEAFKSKGFEVLYLFESIDDYVVSALGKFSDKPLQAVNSSEVDLGDNNPDGQTLSKEDTETLCAWVKEKLGTRVQEVRAGKRLVSSPSMAVVPDGEMTPQMRQMMKALKNEDFGGPSVILEINPSHAIALKLFGLKDSNVELAELVAEQLLDNALMSAGLLDDTQAMINRVNRIMEQAVA
ncbi:molecular chaperone HtpG [Phragmitibacter flavus]|uniref:Chaperone protein HtpG n=1 Tax=Phragmitibacter flavus TaxID=2576071 RepID=A0A5R8KE16_9BACT|nr:molecular chaperone HtpG [Phragmitibacter flavus]TLD69839.1 molecular chaperone HtpG [Phragmitibacter flavus]